MINLNQPHYIRKIRYNYNDFNEKTGYLVNRSYLKQLSESLRPDFKRYDHRFNYRPRISIYGCMKDGKFYLLTKTNSEMNKWLKENNSNHEWTISRIVDVKKVEQNYADHLIALKNEGRGSKISIAEMMDYFDLNSCEFKPDKKMILHKYTVNSTAFPKEHGHKQYIFDTLKEAQEYVKRENRIYALVDPHYCLESYQTYIYNPVKEEYKLEKSEPIKP